MHIEHVAMWTKDIERLRSFYEIWFGGTAGNMYVNESTGFQSYFLTFTSGVRLEIMSSPVLKDRNDEQHGPASGHAHIAFSAGSEAELETLTERLLDAGFRVLDGPRWTGDGYYESIVLDPDGNRIEITV
jgi:lactoylglutathione lyase